MQTAKAACATRPVSQDPTRWIHLLAQLDLILMTIATPTDATAFQRFDRRRRSTAVRQLLLERKRVARELAAWYEPPLGRMTGASKPMEASMPMQSLELEFKALADAFEACSMAASGGGQQTLKVWLLDRAQMHRQHALFLSTF